MRPLRYPALWLAVTCLVTVGAIMLLLLPLPALSIDGPDYSAIKHIIGFGGLVGWYCGIFERRHWILIVLCIVALAFSSEWLQRAMNIGRVADISDLFANVAGISLGIFLSMIGFERWALLIDGWLIRRAT